MASGNGSLFCVYLVLGLHLSSETIANLKVETRR